MFLSLTVCIYLDKVLEASSTLCDFHYGGVYYHMLHNKQVVVVIICLQEKPIFSWQQFAIVL